VWHWHLEIYINELEYFLKEHIQNKNGCLLHHIWISLLIFSDNVVLLASSPNGLQRWLNTLSNFCDLRQQTINVSRTRVVIFDTSKHALSNYHYHFQGEAIDITTICAYLGVQCLRTQFSLRHAFQPHLNKGYGSLALLERQCFQNHFQDNISRMHLLDTIIEPSVLYGSDDWGPSLLQANKARTKRIQTLMLQPIINCK
jgi:hypothetical protein